MNKLKVACVKALLLSKYKKRENRTTIYILNTVSITPHSNSLQQNIDNSKSHFTSISTSKTTSMINNIRKATDEYIHQSSNMSRRLSIINTSSLILSPQVHDFKETVTLTIICTIKIFQKELIEPLSQIVVSINLIRHNHLTPQALSACQLKVPRNRS